MTSRAGTRLRAGIAGAALVLAGCGRAPPNADPAAGANVGVNVGANVGVLDRIVRAESSLAYHGYRLLAQGPIETSRQTRLHVTRTAAGRTCIEWMPEGAKPVRRWQTRNRFPWVDRPDLVRRNYDVALDPGPASPVAWRESRLVHIVPRNAGRPSMDLLVDAEHWLVLAETRLDSSGAEVRSARFETISFGAPEAGAPADDGRNDFGVREADGPDGWTPWRVTIVPAGFERLRGEVCGLGWWYEHWSDGLATMTVSQAREEPAPGAPGPADDGKPGDSGVKVRRISGALALEQLRGGIRVTVVGDVAEEELGRVFGGLLRD